jgi:YHS domain-containing protein
MSVTIEVAIGGYSPVSYFEKGIAEKGKPEISSQYEGKEYLFATESQKSAFIVAPAKYVPAFGGSCAYGHAVEKEFPIDPTNFKIVDGMLLLFLKNAEVDAKALWDKEGDAACMLKANTHWNSSKPA